MAHRKHSLLVLVALVLFACGFAYAEDGEWSLLLQGSEYGALLAATLDATAQRVLAVGATNHRHRAPYEGDVLLVCADLNGDVVWEETWGGEGYEQAWGVVATDDGYLVFGETDSSGAGDRDFFLMAVDTNGRTVWTKTYGTPQREWPFGMLPLANGDLLLYGHTQVSSDGSEDQYAVRVTRDGHVLWERNEPRMENEIVTGALETSAGEIVLCVSHEEDPMLTVLSAGGHALRETVFELPGWQYGESIVAVSNGDFLLAGFSMASGRGQHADVWLARVSPEGRLRWETSLGRSSEDDYAQSLLARSDGTYLIGGIGRGLPLFCVDEDGTVLWESRPAPSSVFSANGLIETAGGSLIVAAFQCLVNGLSYDAALFWLDRTGTLDP